jgi:hypothetical protein
MKARWQLLLPTAFVLVGATLAQTQQGHMVLGAVGVYKTVSYTELAFSDPMTLPRTLEKPHEDLNVSFGIHDVSADASSYAWSVVLIHGTESQVKASGNVLTAAQSRVTVTKSVAVSCTGGRLQVVVRLASPNESISFWVTCPPKGAKKPEVR